jgi:Schlafen, AlbA_2
MADFKFADRADFQKMVEAEIEETLTLEYKASQALTRDSKNVLEMCKDVSAMANSAGGQVVYGIGEDKKTHKPTTVDDGVADEKITREWIHQILGSNIHPRIDGLTVQRIPLSATRYGYVISVEPTQNGPHQAPDKKYYKRFELEAIAMEDYEVRDIMRRATTPDLQVLLSLNGQDTFTTQFGSNQEVSQPFFLDCTVINKSATPATYAIVEVLIDYDLINPFAIDPFVQVGAIHQPPAPRFRQYRRAITSPPSLPIFKEGAPETHKAQIALQLPSSLLGSKYIYLETKVMAQGVFKQEKWGIIVKGNVLQLLHPSHPLLIKAY